MAATVGNEVKTPPSISRGVFSDFKYLLLHKPETETLIKFDSDAIRQTYSQSIMQRIGIGLNNYMVLNVHRLGIEAPASYVFDELLNWDGNSTCWPNHIAKVVRINNRIENIKIFLFGLTKYPFGLKKGFLGLNTLNLFNLKAIRIQRIPDPFDFDNARYLLYRSSGGYPIGVFCMYVRTSIPERQEVEQSQLFFMVGFNFYGKKEWLKKSIINKMWERVHNRVTANVMNRFKQLCEWRFQKIQEGKDL